MPLSLPNCDSQPLAVRSHLAVVVCQLRYETNLLASTIETGLDFHRALGGRPGDYPKLESQEMRSAVIDVGPAGVRSGDGMPLRGWRLRSGDGLWIVSLMPDHASLETTAYTAWADDFRVRLETVLTAVSELLEPSIRERLGLRYINRFPSPPSGQMRDWASWIRPELLGPLTHGDLGQGVTSLQQQVDFDVDPEIGAVLRHGSVKDPDRDVVTGYLLDLDVFSAQPDRFDVATSLTLADRLNETALSLFQVSLTAGYLRHLQTGENVD
jgi:uncharacterized protein (TIGR04255 family)